MKWTGLSRPLQLEPKDKKSLSHIRMEKALEFLKDARSNFKEFRFKTSVNRSYYAALRVDSKIKMRIYF